MKAGENCGMLLMLFLLMAAPASGQETDLNSADTAYVNRLTLLPAIGTSPETSLMLGGVAMQQFKPAKAGPYTRPSSLILSATYTMNNQMLFEFVPAVILPDESWIFEGSVFAYHFPDSYWGIGPETRDDDEISIEYKMFNIRQMVLKKIRPSFYAGPVMRWYYNYDFLFTDSDGREFEPADLIGSEGGSTLGFGGAVRRDKRNSIMTPTQNHFMELNVLFYPEMFGTLFRYAQYWFDARKYYDLKGDANTVLAFHTRWQITRGEVPFLDLADLGGREILRGYYQGRFRDRNSMQFQTEWRQHIKGRFGFTLFGGIGEVWPSADEFSLKNVKSAGGAGIRFNLNPGDTTNLRLDFAMGKNTKGFYLTFGEAF